MARIFHLLVGLGLMAACFGGVASESTELTTVDTTTVGSSGSPLSTASTTVGTTTVGSSGSPLSTASTTVGTTTVGSSGSTLSTASTTVGTTTVGSSGSTLSTASTTVGTTTVGSSGSTLSTASTTVGTTTVGSSGSTLSTASTTVGTTTVGSSGSTLSTASTTVGTTTVGSNVSTLSTVSTTVGTTTVGSSASTLSTASTTVGTTTVGTTTVGSSGSTLSTASTTVGTTTVGSSVSTLSTASTTAGTTTVDSSGSTSPTAPPTDPCQPNPCGRGSTCEPRAHETFVCQCLPGDYYNYESNLCERAKVFPGTIDLPITYVPAMANKSSSEFLMASQEIIAGLNGVFGDQSDNSYINSTVLAIMPSGTRSREQSSPNISASVEIIFGTASTINLTQVENMVNQQLGAQFNAEDLCNRDACQNSTTKCSAIEGGFTCTCLDGYIINIHSERSCAACPSGQFADAESSTCEKCPFGRSGFNCNESWQLILVIVGSVLGALLLLAIIMLPVVALKSSKKTNKRDTGDIGGPYANSSFDQAPLVKKYPPNAPAGTRDGSLYAFANNGAPKIPRATTASRQDSLEMASRNVYPARGNPRIYEDQDEIAPYSETPPRRNPYASVQGHANPYYRDDEGRRF